MGTSGTDIGMWGPSKRQDLQSQPGTCLLIPQPQLSMLSLTDFAIKGYEEQLLQLIYRNGLGDDVSWFHRVLT